MTENKRNYSSIEDILQRKLQLTNEINHEEKNIRRLWNDIFHSKKKNEPKTPAQRITSLINNGSGIIDGALLGWKLYRRFKP